MQSKHPQARFPLKGEGFRCGIWIMSRAFGSKAPSFDLALTIRKDIRAVPNALSGEYYETRERNLEYAVGHWAGFAAVDLKRVFQ